MRFVIPFHTTILRVTPLLVLLDFILNFLSCLISLAHTFTLFVSFFIGSWMK